MKIPPAYSITTEILEMIVKIDANRMFLSSINLSPKLKERIQRVSLLKSSLFSAKIEGNPLTMEGITKGSDTEQKKIEVFNILKSTEFIQNNVNHGSIITRELILNLNRLVLKDLSNESGLLRREMSAIFNQAGVAVYVTPSPFKMPLFIDKLLDYINSDKEKFPLVKAFISHLVFEKIHPFIDGNGRVGRLLVFAILKAKGQNYGICIPFEEYLEKYKDEYYYHLDKGMIETNDFLLFMLKAFCEQSEEIKNEITKETQKVNDEFFLPPRQEEIYNIIKDHAIVSFDMIKRRFLKVPERTLRYDLKKLVDLNLIYKIGKTRGSYYKIKS